MKRNQKEKEKESHTDRTDKTHDSGGTGRENNHKELKQSLQPTVDRLNHVQSFLWEQKKH